MADRKTELALLGLLALLWGSSYTFTKIAVASIPPCTLIAIRVSIATVFLLAIVWARGERLPRDWSTWRVLLVQSLLNSIVAWILVAWGQQYVDSGLAGVLNSTAPIFVLLLTWLWTRHEPTTTLKAAGVAVGIAGVVLIIGLDALRGLGRQVAAQGAVLFGAFLYGCAAIYGRQRLAALSPTVTAAGTMLWATACLPVLSIVVDEPWTLTPSAASLAAAAVLGLACTACALLLYFRLLRTLGSIGVASQAYLRAGVSVLLGMLVLGERLTAPVAIGLGATILGVLMINWPPKIPPARPA